MKNTNRQRQARAQTKFLLAVIAFSLYGQTNSPRPAALPMPGDLKYSPLRPIPAPKVERFTLENGMKLLLLEDHERPLVTGTALIRTGGLLDPSSKVGLAQLAGVVMSLDGTKNKTGEQLDEHLETLGARLECDIGETFGSVSFSTLKENTAEVLTAFHEVLVATEFRQEKIDLAKVRMRNAIARRNDNPRQLAQHQFQQIVYDKGTPYGRREELATVSRVLRGDLQAFHKRYFFPANVILAVNGDFTTAAMKARLETLFSSWTEKQEPPPAFPKLTAGPFPGVFVADRKDATDTFFSLGQLGGQFNEKDYPSLQIASAVLGHGSASRLFRRVRARLAFEISATWTAEFDHPGLFRISGGVGSGAATETIKAVLEEIDRLRAAGITEEELRTGRDAVLHEFVFTRSEERRVGKECRSRWSPCH